MIYLSRKSNLFKLSFRFYQFLIIIVSLTNFTLILLNALVQNPIFSKLLVIKDLFLFLLISLLLVSLFKNNRLKLLSKSLFLLSVLIIIILTIYFIVSLCNIGISPAALIYYRKFLLLSVLIAFISPIYIENFDVIRYVRTYKILAYLIVIFGILEYSLPPDSFLENFLHINSFFSNTNLDPWANVPIFENGRFYSWDLSLLIGKPVRRLISIYADPTITSAILTLLLNIFLFLPIKKLSDKLLLLLIITCGMLTMSKFFVLSLLLSILYYYLKFRIRNIALYVFTLAAIVDILIYKSAIFNKIPSNEHLSGYLNALSNFSLLGRGLGMAGNYAILANGKTSIGGESSFGSLMGQIGIFSSIFIFLINQLLNIIETQYKVNRLIWKRYLLNVIYITILEFFIGLMYSESLISVTVMDFIFLSTLPVLNTISKKES